MSESTKIEWCDSTFNPWTGCAKVSPGCDHCYAESWAKRSGIVQWGPHAERRRTSATNWRLPLQWQNQAAAFQAQHGHRRRVFCASLADVFDNEAPEQWRVDLFRTIAATPDLDWLLLTKRIGNAAKMIQDSYEGVLRARLPKKTPPWPWPNVWLGATVVDQDEADRDIPKLLAMPACVRFLSIGPMLGPISFVGMFANPRDSRDGTNALEEIDLVICEGETGPGARPMHPGWVRSLRDQCEAAGAHFFLKQWGDWIARELVEDARQDPPGSLVYWKAHDMTYRRVGKRAAGRLLDGVEHDGMPLGARTS
jgi:protein gp37